MKARQQLLPLLSEILHVILLHAYIRLLSRAHHKILQALSGSVITLVLIEPHLIHPLPPTAADIPSKYRCAEPSWEGSEGFRSKGLSLFPKAGSPLPCTSDFASTNLGRKRKQESYTKWGYAVACTITSRSTPSHSHPSQVPPLSQSSLTISPPLFHPSLTHSASLL